MIACFVGSLRDTARQLQGKRGNPPVASQCGSLLISVSADGRSTDDVIAFEGAGGYADYRGGNLQNKADKLAAMNFGLNWDAVFPYPYHGMWMPYAPLYVATMATTYQSIRPKHQKENVSVCVCVCVSVGVCWCWCLDTRLMAMVRWFQNPMAFGSVSNLYSGVD